MLPIAVFGSGHQGMASLIRILIEISGYDFAEGESVDLLIFRTHDAPVDAEAEYPLRVGVDELHPFATDRPPADFPTFGDYVRAMSKEDPLLVSALDRPLFGDVTQYLEFMMELGIIAAGEKVSIRAIKEDVSEIREPTPGAPATIVMTDGARIEVSRIIRDEIRPHLP